MDLAPDAFAKECASRVVLDRIGDRWTVLLVIALADGALRFSQLRSKVEGITPKVLTQTLRALERDGLLTRKVFAEVPPRVEYQLTALGEGLMEPVCGLVSWLQAHWPAIRGSRERFDARVQRAASRDHPARPR